MSAASVEDSKLEAATPCFASLTRLSHCELRQSSCLAHQEGKKRSHGLKKQSQSKDTGCSDAEVKRAVWIVLEAACVGQSSACSWLLSSRCAEIDDLGYRIR